MAGLNQALTNSESLLCCLIEYLSLVAVRFGLSLESVKDRMATAKVRGWKTEVNYASMDWSKLMWGAKTRALAVIATTLGDLLVTQEPVLSDDVRDQLTQLADGCRTFVSLPPKDEEEDEDKFSDVAGAQPSTGGLLKALIALGDSRNRVRHVTDLSISPHGPPTTYVQDAFDVRTQTDLVHDFVIGRQCVPCLGRVIRITTDYYGRVDALLTLEGGINVTARYATRPAFLFHSGFDDLDDAVGYLAFGMRPDEIYVVPSPDASEGVLRSPLLIRRLLPGAHRALVSTTD